jgi:hypothetical protein
MMATFSSFDDPFGLHNTVSPGSKAVVRSAAMQLSRAYARRGNDVVREDLLLFRAGSRYMFTDDNWDDGGHADSHKREHQGLQEN